MPSGFIKDFFAYIKNFSWKFYFISVLLVADLLANWYLYSRHPPVPGIEQRCSPRYPEFAMVLEHPVSLPDRKIQEENGTIYSPGQFCYEDNNYRGCPCSVKPCVRKCCAFSDVFDKNYKCMPSQANLSDFINIFREVYRMNVSKGYFSILSNKCEVESSLQNVTLLMDGKISSPSGYLDQSQYCLERSSGSVIAVSCVHDSFAKTLKDVRSMMAHTLRATPTIIHVITLLVYIVLPNQRCGVDCLLVNLLAAMILKGFFNMVIIADLGCGYRILCTSIGLAMQYSWLSCQAWQLVIAYQIWASFRPGILMTQTNTRPQIYSKLPLYRSLAWGLPFLISAFTIIVDLTSFLPSSLKPQMGLKRCWLSNEFTRFLYAVVPVGLTELMTLIFCILTLLQLRSCQQNSAAFCSSNSNNMRVWRKNIEWTKIYLKACFMMGSAYILVSLVALITWNYKSMRGIPVFLVKTVTDIERVRGVEIFFIFVLKEKVFKQLFNKFYLLGESSSEEKSSTAKQQRQIQPLELRCGNLHQGD